MKKVRASNGPPAQVFFFKPDYCLRKLVLQNTPRLAPLYRHVISLGHRPVIIYGHEGDLLAIKWP